MIADEELGQRQRVALGAVGDIDAADLVAQMPRLRDEVPQQILDPLGPLVGDVAVDLQHVDRLAVAVAGKLQRSPALLDPSNSGVKSGCGSVGRRIWRTSSCVSEPFAPCGFWKRMTMSAKVRCGWMKFGAVDSRRSPATPRPPRGGSRAWSCRGGSSTSREGPRRDRDRSSRHSNRACRAWHSRAGLRR